MTIGSDLAFAVAFPCSMVMFLSEKEQCKIDHQHLRAFFNMSEKFQKHQNMETPPWEHMNKKHK
jgi:hypothetical protein